MKVEIVKLDNLGRGIGYIDNKIIFIPKSIPGDYLEVEVTLEKKNYLEGKIIKIIKSSKDRIDSICPYFEKCGGCDFLNTSLSNMLDNKIEKVKEILSFNKIDFEVKKIIKSIQYNYRNKVSLKIINDKIGYYENATHNLVEINYCYLLKKEINEILNDLYLLNIHNGNITIRCNYNNEILISLDTDDTIEVDHKFIENHKIAGIVVNDKCIYGNDYFFEKITNYLFKVSYNAFFQVNPFICEKLFNLIEENINDSKKVLDLYCGVGTLSLLASQSVEEVLGVEIVKNAIDNAIFNANINNIKNCHFICSDTKDILEKINNNWDTIILDPPRSGININVIQKILDTNIRKLIYVSCNPLTLVRDLKLLQEKYKIQDLILLDMFPNTHHVESLCVLNLK